MDTPKAPVIDGKLDEPEWQQAGLITDLKQIRPGDGVPMSEKTEVYVMYDKDALYVAARMWDAGAPGEVSANVMKQNSQFTNDDRIAVIIDPFNTGRNGYRFEVNANVASRRTTQYFEMLGNRAIYHEGWLAATTPATLPWELSTKPAPDVITGYQWELYNVAEDPTEFNDLAAKMPDKLRQMQDLFYAEAAKHDVLPLDNTSLTRWNAPKPNLTGGRTVFTYSGTLTGVPNSGAPSILNRSYTITAEVTIPKGGAEGMIVTDGGRFGGYGLFLSKGVAGIRKSKPVFVYNLLNLKRTVWSGPELGAGKHTIVFDYKPDGPGLGKGGTGVLSVDGKEVARNSLEHSTPITFPEDETFDIGSDTRSGVALLEYRYDVPFKFTGKINKLTFNLGPHLVTAEEREQMQGTVARARD